MHTLKNYTRSALMGVGLFLRGVGALWAGGAWEGVGRMDKPEYVEYQVPVGSMGLRPGDAVDVQNIDLRYEMAAFEPCKPGETVTHLNLLGGASSRSWQLVCSSKREYELVPEGAPRILPSGSATPPARAERDTTGEAWTSVSAARENFTLTGGYPTQSAALHAVAEQRGQTQQRINKDVDLHDKALATLAEIDRLLKVEAITLEQARAEYAALKVGRKP